MFGRLGGRLGKSETDAAIYRGCVRISQLTWKPQVSIPRRPLRRAPTWLPLAGALVVCISAPACAKAPAQAQPAEAIPVKAGGEDTTLPPGVDLSKLDDFSKKVFFRIANSESSVCGQAQSLIVSAKKNCGRSVNALRY